jgi:hypothetical protein
MVGIPHLENIPAPTVEELVDLIFEIDKDPERRGTELAQRLYRILLWELGQHLVWPQQVVDLFRWAVFSRGIKTVGWEKAGQWAAERLAGSPWEGGPHAMEASYKKVQRSLPPEHKRPLTHRPQRSL